MAGEGKVYTYLNPGPLARAVVLWLYIDIATNLFYGITAFIAFGDASALDPGMSKDTPLPHDLLAAAAALAQLPVTLIVAFLILKWTYRVSRNAHSEAKGLGVSPPWAVGFYFIPIAFLWKPFQALRETWQASSQPVGWRTVAVPSMLRWWWGLFLINNTLGQISFRLAIMGTTVGMVAASSAVDVVSAGISVPLNLVFIRIVRELTRKQSVGMMFGGADPIVA